MKVNHKIIVFMQIHGFREPEILFLYVCLCM